MTYSMRLQRLPSTGACLVLGALLVMGAPLSARAGQTPPTAADDEPNRQDQVKTIEIDDTDLPGFLEGTTLKLKPRSYYLNRDRDTNQDNVAWALGGALEYRSGWAWERIQLGGTVFTSQKLHGADDKDGTQLLKTGQKGFTVLGEAYITARIGAGSGLRVGRQSFDLPYLSRHDIRMVPNTFEAIAIGRPAKQGFTYLAGYVDAIKRKNDDRFISMSEAAGAAGSDEGLGMLAGQYTFADGSLIGGTVQESFEVMRTTFVKAEKSFPINNDFSIRAYAQYTDQRSVGDALIGQFGTHLVSVKGELFFPNGSVRIAASNTGKAKGIQSPFGGPPNYPAIIVDNFDRAGEKAWMLGGSYDFTSLGARGLSAFVNVSKGNTPDYGPAASPDETEYNLTVDYKFGAESALRGLAVRIRGAWIDQDTSIVKGDDFFDFRIILNYSYDLL